MTIITRLEGYIITRTRGTFHIRNEETMEIVGWAINQSQALQILREVAYAE